MALQLWMPLMGDTKNQGLGSYSITTLGTLSWVTGKLGATAMRAGDGTQVVNGLQINNNFTTLLNGDYSVSVWVKPYGTHVHYNGSIMSSGNWNTANKRWAFGVSQDNTKVDVLGFNYNTYIDCSVPVNTWTHLVCTCGSDRKIKLYKDGVYIGQRDGSSDPAIDSDASVTCIGRESYASGYFSFNGAIQDLRLYDHCLSEMEIKQLSQGLILHYPLNRGGFGQDNLATCTTPQYNLSASTGNYNYFWIASKDTLTVGETYTVSAEVTVSDNVERCTIYNYHTNPTTSGPQYNYFPADGKRHSWTFTATATGLLGYCGVAGATANHTAVYKNIKIEKGSIATPYIPRSNETLYTSMGLNGTTEYDCSGFCNNLNKNGTYSYTSDTPKYEVTTVFNGTEWMNGTTPGAEIKTLACWAKTTKNKSTSQFMVADSTSNMCISFYSGCIIGVFGTTRSTGSKCTLGSSYKENDWNHFVVVKTGDNGERSIYCNGEPLTATSNDYWSSTTGLFIGSRNNSATLPFYGEICDVRAYATALSADDVKSLYQNCATIDPDGTIRGQIRS